MKVMLLILFINIVLGNEIVSGISVNPLKFSLSNVAHHLVNKCELRNNLSIQRSGFKRIKVGIVGAGISGLYAAILLQDLGIGYEILEATNRIGGRFHTFHFDSLSKYNYVELGAMRFPKLSEFDRFIGNQNWSLISYLNSKLDEINRLHLIPFAMEHPNNIFYFNGKRRYRFEVENNGDLFGFGKNDGGFIDEKYTIKNASFWESKAFDYIKHKFNSNLSSGYDFLLRNDYLTFRGFLMDPRNTELAYPSDVVDWIEDITAQTGRFSFSFMDGYLMLRFYLTDMLAIDGGVSRIIFAMNNILREKPKLKTIVKGVRQKRNGNLVIATNRGKFEYNHVIVTPRFSVLRDIDFDCELQLKKMVAMRTVGNAEAVKISLKFKTRFWENAKLMNGKPIFGGLSITDLRIREIVYPSYGINCTPCSGTLLVSYIQFREAMKSIAFNDKELIEISLKDLSTIHGPIVYKLFTGEYKIMHWSEYKWTQGGFSVLEPGYFMSYYPYLIHPDAKGRLHFSGELLSFYNGWSLGSLISAYRAVKDILVVQGMNEKIKQLESNWGTIDEPDFTHFQ